MNNQINLQQVLSIVYELEGLLLLAQSKGNDTPEEVYNLIQEKLNLISQSFSSKEVIIDQSEVINHLFEPEDEKSHGNIEDDYCDAILEESEDDRSHGDLDDDYIDEFSPETEDERSHGNSEDDYIDLTYNENAQEHSQENLVNNYDAPEVRAEYDSITPENEPIEPEIEIDSNEDEESFEDTNIELADIVSDEIFESIDSETEELDDDIIDLDDIDCYDDFEYDNTFTNELITIEEKITIQNTRDLRTAFTVNDRFRFKRELFGNKDTEFADALNMISAMSSFVEVQEYFYEDLEWDKENPEVIDFLKIISNYFNNKN